MSKYFELHPTLSSPTTSIGATLAKHMENRQYLGTTVVVCDTPVATLSAVRKQWFQLARNLQKQRACTLNAEEILRLTHAIMRMQHLEFTAKPPQLNPNAQVYFVTPTQLSQLPPSCFSLYLLSPTDPSHLQKILSEMPDCGLVINYDVGTSLSDLGLLPKSTLEKIVLTKWHKLLTLLRRLHINPTELDDFTPTRLNASDDALDKLLGAGQEFLHLATDFQHFVHLAQPLHTINAQQQKAFTSIARLAYRVQALSPGTFSDYLIKNFGESDDYQVFFLHDHRFEDGNFTAAGQNNVGCRAS